MAVEELTTLAGDELATLADDELVTLADDELVTLWWLLWARTEVAMGTPTTRRVVSFMLYQKSLELECLARVERMLKKKNCKGQDCSYSPRRDFKSHLSCRIVRYLYIYYLYSSHCGMQVWSSIVCLFLHDPCTKLHAWGPMSV